MPDDKAPLKPIVQPSELMLFIELYRHDSDPSKSLKEKDFSEVFANYQDLNRFIGQIPARYAMTFLSCLDLPLLTRLLTMSADELSTLMQRIGKEQTEALFKHVGLMRIIENAQQPLAFFAGLLSVFSWNWFGSQFTEDDKSTFYTLMNQNNNGLYGFLKKFRIDPGLFIKEFNLRWPPLNQVRIPWFYNKLKNYPDLRTRLTNEVFQRSALLEQISPPLLIEMLVNLPDSELLFIMKTHKEILINKRWVLENLISIKGSNPAFARVLLSHYYTQLDHSFWNNNKPLLLGFLETPQSTDELIKIINESTNSDQHLLTMEELLRPVYQELVQFHNALEWVRVLQIPYSIWNLYRTPEKYLHESLVFNLDVGLIFLFMLPIALLVSLLALPAKGIAALIELKQLGTIEPALIARIPGNMQIKPQRLFQHYQPIRELQQKRRESSPEVLPAALAFQNWLLPAGESLDAFQQKLKKPGLFDQFNRFSDFEAIYLQLSYRSFRVTFLNEVMRHKNPALLFDESWQSSQFFRQLGEQEAGQFLKTVGIKNIVRTVSLLGHFLNCYPYDFSSLGIPFFEIMRQSNISLSDFLQLHYHGNAVTLFSKIVSYLHLTLNFGELRIIYQRIKSSPELLSVLASRLFDPLFDINGAPLILVTATDEDWFNLLSAIHSDKLYDLMSNDAKRLQNYPGVLYKLAELKNPDPRIARLFFTSFFPNAADPFWVTNYPLFLAFFEDNTMAANFLVQIGQSQLSCALLKQLELFIEPFLPLLEQYEAISDKTARLCKPINDLWPMVETFLDDNKGNESPSQPLTYIALYICTVAVATLASIPLYIKARVASAAGLREHRATEQRIHDIAPQCPKVNPHSLFTNKALIKCVNTEIQANVLLR